MSTTAPAPPSQYAPLARGAAVPGARVSLYPFIGLLGIFLGALTSTLTGRLTTLGIADIRGAVGASFDEGAWINTTFSAGQMLIGPIAVWLGFVFGVRRVLVPAITIFGICELLLPFSPDIRFLLAFQGLAGLASGTFIPLTIGFVLQNLKPKYWAYGIGIYAMNLELSLHIAATLEGWYAENLSWRWIFWQNTVACILMLPCIVRAVPLPVIRLDALGDADYSGMLCAAIGFSMLYVALDQGERLFWLDSPIIRALLLAGLGCLAAFFAIQTTSPKPSIDLSSLVKPNVLVLIALLVLVRFVILAVNFIIPQFLSQVAGYRPAQIGQVLLWVAAPQLILAPMVATWLTYRDGRWSMGLGFLVVGIACWSASTLTSVWSEENFILSQTLQAVGQSFALTSVIYYFARHVEPAFALTFGAIIQTARLFGGEIGAAAIQTASRVSEQVNSNLLGLHVLSGGPGVARRLEQLTNGLSTRTIGTGKASERALSLLDHSVRAQAQTLAFSDAYVLAALAAFAGVFLVVLLRRAPPLPPEPST